MRETTASINPSLSLVALGFRQFSGKDGNEDDVVDPQHHLQ